MSDLDALIDANFTVTRFVSPLVTLTMLGFVIYGFCRSPFKLSLGILAVAGLAQLFNELFTLALSVQASYHISMISKPTLQHFLPLSLLAQDICLVLDLIGTGLLIHGITHQQPTHVPTTPRSTIS
jgi:hypothetical protein